MRIEEFNYDLPSSLIAQYPSPARGETALMVLHRDKNEIEHRRFSDLLQYLHPGDLLIMNNTRVLPTRLIGKKETGGKIEVLLYPSWNGSKENWKALIKGAKKVRPGTRIRFELGFEGELKEIGEGKWTICFSCPVPITEILQKIGHIPLPPYIKRKDLPLDKDRYQTIFAERDGSVAAPTAGLHFTHSLIRSLNENEVRIQMITLHIGIGTFTPVKTPQIEEHQMEAEWAEISQETAKAIEETKARGRKVIAVGTTTTRALEAFSDHKGGVKPGKGMTTLFIYPPFPFQVIDGLITNFHLPKSTLMLLVCAFAGKDLIKRAYQEAIERKYRFYSYGDAMLIL